MSSAMAALVTATRSVITKHFYTEDFRDLKLLAEIGNELVVRFGGHGNWVAHCNGAVMAKFPTKELAKAYALIAGEGVRVAKND